jgi:hypothetical protein
MGSGYRNMASIRAYIEWWLIWLRRKVASPCACDNTKHMHCCHCGGKLNL